MKEPIRFLSDETQNFINSNQVLIDMYKREARIKTQQYEESARRKAQSKIGQINFQDDISRKDLQSASGTLNINSENYYKECLRKLLKQIPNITEQYIEDILFTA